MKHSKKGSRGTRLYFSHFQNRILCAFLLCTLIPIFIIGGISYAVSYNIAKDKILNASISADAGRCTHGHSGYAFRDSEQSVHV